MVYLICANFLPKQEEWSLCFCVFDIAHEWLGGLGCLAETENSLTGETFPFPLFSQRRFVVLLFMLNCCGLLRYLKKKNRSLYNKKQNTNQVNFYAFIKRNPHCWQGNIAPFLHSRFYFSPSYLVMQKQLSCEDQKAVFDMSGKTWWESTNERFNITIIVVQRRKRCSRKKITAYNITYKKLIACYKHQLFQNNLM